MKLSFLRKNFLKFVFKKYSCQISGNRLKISFYFETRSLSKKGDIFFNPAITIRNVGKIPSKNLLNNLVFNLGLIEMLSYWKATCSPEILVEAGHLNNDQIKWWENMILTGMGQFFYENKINWKKPGFLKISSSGPQFPYPHQKRLKERYLVPFAGGRDSIITLEELKKQKKEISLFTVNPIDRIQKAVKVSGIKRQIVVERKIDKTLLELNKKGYLNGHTPFTSFLSFLAVLCAVLFDYKHVVFSNEKSANEGNVRYLGRTINHQWAKSSEFEKKFKSYAKKYLAKNVDYFSYLRKYGELEISKMLIEYPQYFPVFSSCNAGMKLKLKSRERWCGNCPKCLFIYSTLYPYLNEKELNQIFGKDIFNNKDLFPIMRDLTEEKRIKPFECVGTKKESRQALGLCLKKAIKQKNLPYLLAKIKA